MVSGPPARAVKTTRPQSWAGCVPSGRESGTGPYELELSVDGALQRALGHALPGWRLAVVTSLGDAEEPAPLPAWLTALIALCADDARDAPTLGEPTLTEILEFVSAAYELTPDELTGYADERVHREARAVCAALALRRSHRGPAISVLLERAPAAFAEKEERLLYGQARRDAALAATIERLDRRLASRFEHLALGTPDSLPPAFVFVARQLRAWITDGIFTGELPKGGRLHFLAGIPKAVADAATGPLVVSGLLQRTSLGLKVATGRLVTDADSVEPVEYRGLLIDPDRREASLWGQPLALGSVDFQVLWLLASIAEPVPSGAVALLLRVIGDTRSPESKATDVAARLRTALGDEAIQRSGGTWRLRLPLER